MLYYNVQTLYFQFHNYSGFGQKLLQTKITTFETAVLSYLYYIEPGIIVELKVKCLYVMV